MSKPNKDGWIRHRGGKCPVEAGALVDVKRRDGDIFYAESALEGFAKTWSHSLGRADIMAYRIYKPAEQPAPVSEPVERKCEGRACEMPDAESHSKECLLDAAIDQGWAGPLQWRDRIIEIDRTVEALEEERVALVQRLEGEGFRLIGRVVQPVEDMSDWRNWKAGDLLEVIDSEPDSHDFSTGEIVEMLEHDTNKRRDAPHCKGRRNDCWVFVENLKFNSRPSK